MNRAHCECDAPYFGESCFSLAPIQILEPWHPKAPRDWKPLSIHGKTAKQFVGDQQSRYIRIDVPKLDRYGIDNEEPVHMRIGFHVKTALADVLLRGLWAPFYSDMTDVRKYPSESKNDFTLDIGNKEIIIPSCQVKQIVQEGKSLYLEVHGAHVAHRSQKASMEVNMQWLRTYVSKSHWFKATKNDKKSSDKIPGSVCCGQIVSYHIESGMGWRALALNGQMPGGTKSTFMTGSSKCTLTRHLNVSISASRIRLFIKLKSASITLTLKWVHPNGACTTLTCRASSVAVT